MCSLFSGILFRNTHLLGIINLILSPFILIYNIISFIFLNIDELYINKKVLGPRRYTLYFKWKMRQYNELEHHFNYRLNRSLKHSIEYTKQFPSLFTENIAKFKLLLSGGFIVFFLILSVLDENILRTTKKGKFLSDGIASDLFMLN